MGARTGCLPPDLSRHLRDRAPQPGVADPLRNPERTTGRAGRARLRAVDRHGRDVAVATGCRCSASTRTGPPATSTCSRSTCRPSSSTRTCSSAWTSRACRSATRTGRPQHPIVIAGGHCAYNPEPLAEYVDAFVMGDGEEVISEVAEVIGAWKRGGRASREAVLHELATIEGVYVPAMYEVDYDGRVHPRGATRASTTFPRRSTSARSRISPSGRTRSSSSCRSSRSCTTG